MADRSVSVFGFIALLGVMVGGCASEGTMGSSGSRVGIRHGDGHQPGCLWGLWRIPQDACLARIPKDATAGQKMLAEESCRRDQAARR